MSDSQLERDELYMRRALELAARGLSSTDPNPRVGCVLVNDGRIIAEGWHERAGEAHAEVHALRAAGTAAAGATAYVTLEPCVHTGRTPPCTEALIAAQVARVVYAAQDRKSAGARRRGGGFARRGDRGASRGAREREPRAQSRLLQTHAAWAALGSCQARGKPRWAHRAR